jgi:alanine racemase
MSKFYRKTYAKIYLHHILSNYNEIQKQVGTSKKIMPVVKADAYGHGAREVVAYLHQHGIDHYAVSLLEEALELRIEHKDIFLLCLGLVDEDGLLVASENKIAVTISNFNQISNVRKIEKPLTVHLKIDTGMHRLGFRSIEDIAHAFEELKQMKHVNLQGIYTHFATADEDWDYYQKQLTRFKEVLVKLDYPFEMVHISNSASQLEKEPDFSFTTHTRLGISLYGLTVSSKYDFLQNTFKLVTTVGQINILHPGDRLGYGGTYVAKQKEYIAILPIGYADGFIRRNAFGDVEINSNRYPIVGRICMDMTFVKVDETVHQGDEVVLMGGLVSIDEIAKRLDTINYEVICDIGKRVPRIYIDERGELQ